MQEHRIGGTLKLFGEPAEKLRASKPIHAAKGYYDALDAAVSFHPHYLSPLCNTVAWDTHCGVGYNYIYTFTCDQPENWIAADRVSPIPQNHLSARAPGANDALMMFHHLNEGLRRSMLPATGLWSFNEAILTAGQATADNLAPHVAQINYMVRTDSIAQADIISFGHGQQCGSSGQSRLLSLGARPGFRNPGAVWQTTPWRRRPTGTSNWSGRRAGAARRSASRGKFSATSASSLSSARSLPRSKSSSIRGNASGSCAR